MKKSMYGTGTETTDLREKEKDFISFIIINGGDDFHQAYLFVNKRIYIKTYEGPSTDDEPYISIKDYFKGTQIVVFQYVEKSLVGVCNQSEDGNIRVYVNNQIVKKDEVVKVSRDQDFYIYIICHLLKHDIHYCKNL